MMLEDYAATLYDVKQNDEPFCVINVSVTGRKLHIQRVDFDQWEYNRRTGRVEGLDALDEANTKRLCECLGVTASAGLMRVLKREFGKDGDSFFDMNFRDYCDAHQIIYEHRVWY